MSDEWPIVRLGGYCSKIGSGATPSGGSSVYIEQGEICLIRSQNIYNDGFKPDGLVFITEDAANKLKNVIVQKNDILLNITGDSVARVCLAREEFLPARVNQHVAIIRPNPNEFDPRYLRYFLASPAMQSFLLTIAAVGATRSALTKVMIETLEVSKPPIQIQTAIADQLESLDNKIHLNTQTNQTLEQIAQAIFKSWFVDFDPVKAKIAALNSLSLGERAGVRARELAELAAMSVISGKDEAQLAQLKMQDAEAYQQLEQTAALFPAAMQESELGEIPEGWEVKRVEDVLELAYGKALGKTDREDGNIPVYGSGGITGWHNKSLINGPGIIIGRKGTVGSIYWEKKDFFAIDTVFFVRIKDEISLSYAFYLLQTLGLEKMNTDAAVPGLNRNNVYRLEIVGAPNLLVSRFSMIADSLKNKVDILGEQSDKLNQLRDSLLPKLLSGEIDLSDNALTLTLSQGERGLESANG